MADDARDAKKYRLLLRWLRDGRIPGPAHGRPFKLIETCPQFGDEREVPDIDRDLEGALGVPEGQRKLAQHFATSPRYSVEGALNAADGVDASVKGEK